jgi:hypothetical protein
MNGTTAPTQQVLSCTLIVTAANAFASCSHNRMPVFLKPENIAVVSPARQGQSFSSQRAKSFLKFGLCRNGATEPAAMRLPNQIAPLK